MRPQLALALAALSLEAFDRYISFLGTSDTEAFHKRIVELDERVRLANRLHEEYLVNRTNGGEHEENPSPQSNNR